MNADAIGLALFVAMAVIGSIALTVHGYRAGFVRGRIYSWALKREITGREARIFGYVFIVAGVVALLTIPAVFALLGLK